MKERKFMNVQKLRLIGLFAFSALGSTIGNTTLSYASSNSSVVTGALNSRGEKRVGASPKLIAIATPHRAKIVYADDGIYSFTDIGTGSQPMTTAMPIAPVADNRNFASFKF
jgi:hypothetical protein